MSNVYTYTTEIKNRAYNVDLMKYITEYKGLFSFVQRKAFHIIKNSYVNTGKFTLQDKNALTKNIATKYNLTARTASSIVYNMTGRFNAIKELKEYENIKMTTSTLMFNGRPASENDKIELEKILKDFFVKALLKKRADEENDRQKKKRNSKID